MRNVGGEHIGVEFVGSAIGTTLREMGIDLDNWSRTVQRNYESLVQQHEVTPNFCKLTKGILRTLAYTQNLSEAPGEFVEEPVPYTPAAGFHAIPQKSEPYTDPALKSVIQYVEHIIADLDHQGALAYPIINLDVPGTDITLTVTFRFADEHGAKYSINGQFNSTKKTIREGKADQILFVKKHLDSSSRGFCRSHDFETEYDGVPITGCAYIWAVRRNGQSARFWFNKSPGSDIAAWDVKYLPEGTKVENR